MCKIILSSVCLPLLFWLFDLILVPLIGPHCVGPLFLSYLGFL